MKIDYYAYHSGMNGWNAGLKMLLAVGTLCLTIALSLIHILPAYISVSGRWTGLV